ncbi:hypothetical protein QCA50_017528 [Cerrena zonata]|uniref:UAA transporter n=1 Tax=Cerrena zonata TaxID=2478898 RepID=A0AAW0FKN2_9APHY
MPRRDPFQEMVHRRDTVNAALAQLALHSPTQKKNRKGKGKENGGTIVKAAAVSAVDLTFILSLVLGGCCSTVWAFEYLLNIDPRMGTTLTFSQMAFVTLVNLPSFLVWRRPYKYLPPLPGLKPRQVPLTQWILQVIVLITGSLLNNAAFAFHIPLTLQIVFRSAGLAVSMLFGYLFLNKTYIGTQVASVILVTTGVILATLARPESKNHQPEDYDPEEYTQGVTMLTVSLFLTGTLGILQEKTFKKYGPCWRESVFYTHFLSLPFFLMLIPQIKLGFGSLAAATNRPPLTPHSLGDYASKYTPYLALAANLVSQLICTTGVNQLTSSVSSVSTNLVLTIRKAISLCFSVWWFGNEWNTELGVGATMVFLGSMLYTMVGSNTVRRHADAKKE